LLQSHATTVARSSDMLDLPVPKKPSNI
jgi:hypothetical protein